MAILKSIIQFEGKLESMNAYLPKGRDEADGYIIRKNGGPSRKQIEKLPSCEGVRRSNNEFGTCSAAAKSVRSAIRAVKHLADVNLAAQFTSLCRHIMTQDKESRAGERMVLLSQFGNLMSGFNLNKHHLFDSVVRHPILVTLDRGTAVAVVQLPALQPGVGVVLPWQQPMYRLIVSLGIAGDVLVKGRSYPPQPDETYYSQWYTSQQAAEAATVTLQLRKVNKDECMVVAVGIEIGTMVSDMVIDRVKHTGCGKILIAG